MHQFKGAKFLILDDDPLIRKTMQMIAKRAGIPCKAAALAAEFFSELESWQPTHIAIDLIMPDMDGLEVIMELARRKCDACLIITSGIGSRILDAAKRSAHEHGLNIIGILPKPFPPRQLQDLIKQSHVAGLMEVNNDLSTVMPGTFVVTEQEIHNALSRRHFVVNYQPKINCTDGNIIGFEVLARWMHPEWGFVSPDSFIALAEKTGQIHELTDQVFDLALQWRSQLPSGTNIQLAINLSPVTISMESLLERQPAGGQRTQSFADRVEQKCKHFNIPPSSIVLELTETSAMENPADSLSLLTRLRIKGFELSIDDFGTGFSSMQQLARLPFSEIKIDKSFTMTALQSKEASTIVTAIINLGHNLGMRVIAEGVEDVKTLIFLRDNGCDMAQGFLIAEPMTPTKTSQWLQDWQPTVWPPRGSEK